MTTAVAVPADDCGPARNTNWGCPRVDRVPGPLRLRRAMEALDAGSDSPLNTDWSTTRSARRDDPQIRGTISPGRSITMSPGTRSCSGISRCSGVLVDASALRRTVTVDVTSSRNAAVALTVRVCCQIRSTTANATITATVTAPRRSPATTNTTPNPPTAPRMGYAPRPRPAPATRRPRFPAGSLSPNRLQPLSRFVLCQASRRSRHLLKNA